MSCCGERRTAATAEAFARRTPVTVRSAIRPQETQLRCRNGKSLSLRGPHSGRPYRFLADTALNVDARDVQALLRTGLFEVA